MKRKNRTSVVIEPLEQRQLLSAAPAANSPLIPPAAQVTEITNIGFRAFFESTLPDGNTCDVTFVAGQDWVKSPDGTTTTDVQAAINVHVYDLVHYIDWFDSITDPFDAPIIVNLSYDRQLHTMHAVGTLDLDDEVSGDALPLEFDITCTNLGSPQVENDLFVDNDTPGVTAITAIQGVAYNAQASGTVKLLYSPFTGYGSDFYHFAGNFISQPSLNISEIDYFREYDMSVSPALKVSSGEWSYSYTPKNFDVAGPLSSVLFSQAPVSGWVIQNLLSSF